MNSQWDNAWPLQPDKQLTHDDYTIAWLCALPIEKTAARNMLDEVHQRPPQPEVDKNIYEFGSIGGHNVVIVCQGDMGSTATTVVATRMEHTFRKLRFGLLVGIGGGVPDYHDVRLGDVVISKGDGRSGGVISHDRGRVTFNGFDSRPFLNGVPEVLRNAFAELDSRLMDQDNMVTTYISNSTQRNPRFRQFSRPIHLPDDLYRIDYQHVGPGDQMCVECDWKNFSITREERPAKDETRVMFGTVASGDQVIKDGKKRAEIAATNNDILAIEMEAAGLMDVFGCATIRGISDYADSHKNYDWQKYAAAAAAAVAKEVLGIIPAAAIARSAAVPVAEPTSVRPIGNEYFHVPRQVNPNFTGRQKVLEVLEAQLCPPNHNRQTPDEQRRLVICGVGGCGKSEVCLKFAEQQRNLFWGIFWIDCTSVNSIKRSFANISKRCGIGEDFEQAKLWLQDAKNSWLLILDNADDPEIDYSKYMPSGNRGCILMTTRNPECKVFSTVGDDVFLKIDFEKLAFEDAVTLLLKSSGVSKVSWDQERPDAEEVVRILSQHALAIINAGAYVKEKLCTLKNYPSEFIEQHQTLLKHHPKQANSTYGDVYATFAISTDKVTQRALTDPAYHAALDLFDTFGYMSFGCIIPEIWERAFHHTEFGYYAHDDDIEYLSNWHKSYIRRFLRSNEERLSQKQLLRRGVNVLISFSLVNEQKDSGILTMHPLAHAWARDRRKPEAAANAWTRTAVILRFAIGATRKYDVFCRQLWLHVSFCMQEYFREQFWKSIWSINPPLEIARTIYQLCFLLYREDDKATALDGFNSIQEHLMPFEGSLNWLRLQRWIASCIGHLGNLPRELVLREEMEVYHHNIKDEDLRWQLKEALGISYEENRQYKQALQVQKNVLRWKKKKFKPTDSNLLRTQAGLAGIYHGLGRYSKAIKLCKKVIDVSANDMDRTDPNLLFYKHQLGLTYLDKGIIPEAISILENVVEIGREVLRPTNSNLLTSQHVLARAYAASGAHEKAIEMMKEIVKIRSKTLDSGDHRRLDSELRLGQFYLEIKSFSEAIGILEKVVRIRKLVLGSFDFHLLHSQGLLGQAYFRNGMYTEAIGILKEVHEATVVNPFDLCDIWCLQVRWDLAISYWKTANKENMLRLLEEVVPLLVERMEPTSPEREDFERLLERCREDPDKPLGSEFKKHRNWKRPDDASETCSISGIEDEDIEDENEDEDEDHSTQQPDEEDERAIREIEEEEARCEKAEQEHKAKCKAEKEVEDHSAQQSDEEDEMERAIREMEEEEARREKAEQEHKAKCKAENEVEDHSAQQSDEEDEIERAIREMEEEGARREKAEQEYMAKCKAKKLGSSVIILNIKHPKSL